MSNQNAKKQPLRMKRLHKRSDGVFSVRRRICPHYGSAGENPRKNAVIYAKEAENVPCSISSEPPPFPLSA